MPSVHPWPLALLTRFTTSRLQSPLHDPDPLSADLPHDGPCLNEFSPVTSEEVGRLLHSMSAIVIATLGKKFNRFSSLITLC